MAIQEQGSKSFFKRLRGNKNAFAMLLYEPMWGIPYNLFIPYISLYMAALGCTPVQIGLINTVAMVFQMLFSLLASPITDRLGRRKTSLIFDVLSWSVGIFFWIFAQNFWYFLAAAVIQSINRVVHVSWTCLMVEDTDKSLLVHLFSWLTIAGLASSLFAPFSVGLVARSGVVPAMRILMSIAFVLMTAMFILRNASTRETSVGRVRMEQSRREPFFSQIVAMFKVTVDIWHNKKTLFFFVLTALYNASLAVKGPFFALLLTDTLRFAEDTAGWFSAASSLVMLAIYLFAQPVLARLKPKAPLSVGLLLCALGAAALIPAFHSWAANLAAVIVSVVLNAAGTAVAQPFIDGISHASIDNDKRSNMTSILMALTLFTSAPFGLLGGWLFKLNTRLPFLAGMVLFILSAALLLIFYRNEKKSPIEAEHAN